MGQFTSLTRRRFLALAGLGGAASLLAACQPAVPAAKPTEAAKPAAPAPTTAAAAPAKPAEAAKPAEKPAAPAAPAQAAKPGSGEPLKVVLSAELTSLDPSIDTIKSSVVVQNTVLETLAMNTPDEKFIPWLAESWQSVAPTKWRIKLRQGVKFTNGEVFNADSVTYSVNVWLTTKGIGRSWYDFMTGAEKVDEYTVDLVTAEPASIVPSSMAFLYMFPPKYHAQVGQEGFGKSPIGTGAWKFVEWQPGVQLRVTPNPDYWGKKPSVGDVNFRWAPDASARVALLETGEVHLAQNIPPALVERVERSGSARIETVKSIRKVFLQMNVQNGPTADVRVRRAMNHAIDVDGIIKTLFRGRAYGRDKGIITESMEGYQGDKLQPFTYDPDKAKSLLAEAGFANGFEMQFLHPIGRYMLDKESSEAIVGQLDKVGIKAQIQGMESGAYFNKLTSSREPGSNFFSCGPLFMNPTYCAKVHFWPAAGYGYGANEQTEKLIKEAIAAVDEPKRIAAFQALENYVYNEHVPWVWLWHQQDIYGASNKVDWKPRSDELMSFEAATFK